MQTAPRRCLPSPARTAVQFLDDGFRKNRAGVNREASLLLNEMNRTKPAGSDGTRESRVVVASTEPIAMARGPAGARPSVKVPSAVRGPTTTRADLPPMARRGTAAVHYSTGRVGDALTRRPGRGNYFTRTGGFGRVWPAGLPPRSTSFRRTDGRFAERGLARRESGVCEARRPRWKGSRRA